MRTGSSILTLSLLAAALAPTVAVAQDAESLRRELEAMRQQFEAMKQHYEIQMKELGSRIEALESAKTLPPGPVAAPPESTMPTTRAQPAPPLPGAPPLASGSQPSITDLLQPRQPFAFAQPGRILLFDMGVAGDFVTDFTSFTHERRHDGTFNGRENRFFPRHLELAFFGRVDPYAGAAIRLTAAEGPPGRTGREAEITTKLEEANGIIYTLPFGTTVRFGLMAPRFGTLNVVHEDDLPQVDRPDVLRRFLGQEELNTEKGIEAFGLLPTPFYEELSVGVFNGDNELAFGRGSLRDPFVLARLRSFFELGESGGGLQLDMSGGSGVTSDDHRNTIAGLGLKYKWSPLVGYAFPVVTLAGEAIYGNRLARLALDDSVIERRFERWGYYAYGQYDWTKRWAAGLRYDWTELPTSTGHEWALSPYLQFKPSEFLRFRVQYKHTEGTRFLGHADELFLQGSFIIGAHPTERF